MTRRMRIKKSSSIITGVDKSSMTKLVNEYARGQLQIDELGRSMVSVLQNLHKCMRECGVLEWETTLGKAIRVTPVGRSSTIIDKAAFREHVSDEEFMESIKIGVTKAKEVLSGKELAEVSETIPGVKGSEVVKVKVFKPET